MNDNNTEKNVDINKNATSVKVIERKPKTSQIGKVGEATGLSVYSFVKEFKDLIKYFLDRWRDRRKEGGDEENSLDMPKQQDSETN